MLPPPQQLLEVTALWPSPTIQSPVPSPCSSSAQPLAQLTDHLLLGTRSPFCLPKPHILPRRPLCSYHLLFLTSLTAPPLGLCPPFLQVTSSRPMALNTIYRSHLSTTSTLTFLPSCRLIGPTANSTYARGQLGWMSKRHPSHNQHVESQTPGFSIKAAHHCFPSHAKRYQYLPGC